MQDEKSVKSEQEPTKFYQGKVPRVREVATEVRTLIQDLRGKGISKEEIVIGIIIAIQSASVTKTISENPEIKQFLDKVGTFVRSGLDLLDITKKKG